MSKQLICSVCGNVGKAKTPIKGSGLIEIILWLSFILPGLLYTIWRRSGLSPVCTACGSKNLIPLDTPVGLKLLSEQGKSVEEVKSLDAEVKPTSVSITNLIIFGFIAVLALSIISSFFAG